MSAQHGLESLIGVCSADVEAIQPDMQFDQQQWHHTRQASLAAAAGSSPDQSQSSQQEQQQQQQQSWALWNQSTAV
jgi:hypothetical protein